jgi:3-oxoacyl-[acyl-carrier protein] reductase
MMELKGKTAVVTGGGRGIGREIALTLAAAGADVAVLYRKQEAPAAAVRAEIEKQGSKARAYHCDVSDPDRVRETFARIKDDFGRVDILVNNAGLASWGHFIHDTTFEEWDKVMKADISGPYLCIREVLPLMRAQQGGHIINISSSITRLNPPTGGPYAVAKAGVEALTKVLAAEETSHNIHVNAIAPGLVETDMGRKLVKVSDMASIAGKMPFGRVCQPADIANLALFLVTSPGSYIQGQVIYLNGGRTM